MAYSCNPDGESLLQLQANTCPCVQARAQQKAVAEAAAAAKQAKEAAPSGA